MSNRTPQPSATQAASSADTHEHRWSKSDDLGFAVCKDARCGAESWVGRRSATAGRP